MTRRSLLTALLASPVLAITRTRLPAAPLAWVNVRDHGATGDGVTDDGPALRRAVAAVMAQGGGTVYLPAGTYRL